MLTPAYLIRLINIPQEDTKENLNRLLTGFLEAPAMARFTDELLTHVKQNISLVRLAENVGVELKKHGKDYLGRCPFHDDKTPGLVISPESNLWNCLGACGQRPL
jgi:hypothetical protein